MLSQFPKFLQLSQLSKLLTTVGAPPPIDDIAERRRLEPSDVAGRMRLLILQATPFCNVDCDYCYLPSRDDRHRMPLGVVEAAVRFVVEAALPAPDATVCWHAGEPLTVPVDWYRAAFRRIAETASGSLPHAIQTNAMLVDDRWCDFFLEHRVRVGVSLDGPADLHDARRRSRAGRGTHAAAMRGVDRLRRNGVPFHVITVVTDATLDRAEDLAAFYRSEGMLDVAFNIEELEGANLRSSLYGDHRQSQRFRAFLCDFLATALRGPRQILLREWRDLLGGLAHPAFGRMTSNSQNTPFAMVSVSSRGDLFTFSPELAGLKRADGGSLAIGLLPGARLDRILADPRFIALWGEIADGIAACRSCAYFDLCLGGAPSNKLAEHGHFRGGETTYCQYVSQAVADVGLAELERLLAPRDGVTALDRSRPVS